jgi:hypothetical protein
MLKIPAEYGRDTSSAKSEDVSHKLSASLVEVSTATRELWFTSGVFRTQMRTHIGSKNGLIALLHPVTILLENLYIPTLARGGLIVCLILITRALRTDPKEKVFSFPPYVEDRARHRKILGILFAVS